MLALGGGLPECLVSELAQEGLELVQGSDGRWWIDPID